MEIRVGEFGVEVTEMQKSRPVSKLLHKGDILRSYELVRSPGSAARIVSGEDVDRLKNDLSRGEKVLLTILRPNEHGNSLAYQQLVVTLTAEQLLPITTVDSRQYDHSTKSDPDSRPYLLPDTNNAHASYASRSVPALVSVFYATDRALVGSQYSGGRDLSESPLKYGVCTVSLPPIHRPGQHERPLWYKLEFRENPSRHIVLRNVAQLGKTETFNAIRATVQRISPARKRALVYVHGYNVAFDAAARNAAQLHYDLEFQGIATMFSWPSNAELEDYPSDSEDVQWSVPHVVQYLIDLQGEFDDLYIVAHSMGSRAITNALVELSRTAPLSKVRELVLAAADLDAQVFERDIAPVISRSVANSTIYASSVDRALWGSYAISDNPRVGEIREGVPTCRSRSNIDIIDASAARTDLLGHSYYSGASIVADIAILFDKGARPPRPFLKPIDGGNGKYWEYEIP
jgi:esterase/lipase superfamily enzyme